MLNAPNPYRWDSTVANQVLRFPTADGPTVYAEIDERDEGYSQAGRGGRFTDAAETFEAALDQIKAIAAKSVRLLRDGTLRPDGVEIEFGVHLDGEVGAVLAKSRAGGHLNVKLTWEPGHGPAPTPGTAEAAAAPAQA